MASNRRLRGDIPRAFVSHKGDEATRYRRSYDALALELGPFPRGSMIEHQAVQVAVLELEFTEATRVLSEARRLRAAGRGRRPSATRLDRLAHRVQVTSAAFSTALEALRAAVPPRSYQEVLAIKKARQDAEQARTDRAAARKARRATQAPQVTR